MKLLLFISANLVITYSLAQNSKLSEIETATNYANYGDYDSLCNCIVYFGISVGSTTDQNISTSLRVKFLDTNEDTLIKQNVFEPAIGWIYEDHFLCKEIETQDKIPFLGAWQAYLISYNINNMQTDTVPSPWFQSTNHVDKLYVSNGNLFYTISYGLNKLDNTYLMQYNISSDTRRIIKKFKTSKLSIITYQYLIDENEVIYIESKGIDRKLIILSIKTGHEKVLLNLDFKHIEEASLVFNNKFYFVVRSNVDVDNEFPWRKVTYTLKAINLKTLEIETIYISNREITMLSPFKGNKILISMQVTPNEESLKKKFYLNDGTGIELDMNIASQLYLLNIKHNMK